MKDGSRHRYTLEGEEAVVGRDEGLPICLPFDGVSRRHLLIRRDARGWWLEDLQSTNGTFLNGERTRRGRLRHLDVISLGRAAELVFLLRAETKPATRPGIVRAVLQAEASGLRYDVAPGEATLGRAAACNLAFDHESVSKMHARLERTTDQLVLRDLGSANGTFVNGQRVQVAVLKDGDTLALAGAEPLRVAIVMGEVTSGSGVRAAPVLPPPPSAEQPAFSPEWKTRYEWDQDELAIFEAVRRGEPPPSNPTVKYEAPAEEPAAPARPAPEAARPAVPAAPTPARPAASAAPTPARPAAPAAPTRAQPPVPAAPTPPPPPPAASAPVTAPPSTPSRTRPPITAVRLRGSDVDLSIAAPGTYLIGRSPEVPLRIQHNTVSRRHASLILSPDRSSVEIRDEGGANGTFVNGTAVKATHPLTDGDTLLIGHVPLRVDVARGSKAKKEEP